MKAHIKAVDRLTVKQLEAINEYTAEEIRRQGADVMRRFFKLTCVCLHDQFGFGAERCSRLCEEISTLAEKHPHDEVFWTHVDQVMEQMGMAFIPENYEEMDR